MEENYYYRGNVNVINICIRSNGWWIDVIEWIGCGGGVI